jgi:hypothetical protein
MPELIAFLINFSKLFGVLQKKFKPIIEENYSVGNLVKLWNNEFLLQRLTAVIMFMDVTHPVAACYTCVNECDLM